MGSSLHFFARLKAALLSRRWRVPLVVVSLASALLWSHSLYELRRECARDIGFAISIPWIVSYVYLPLLGLILWIAAWTWSNLQGHRLRPVFVVLLASIVAAPFLLPMPTP
ncbi:MAG: hypothetical protein NTV21_19045 [Planctomycetota bacterium]|nr:hypothetical protein [Planctomycetota bacterium]